MSAFPRRLLLFALPTPLVALDGNAATRTILDPAAMPICRSPLLQRAQYTQRTAADEEADLLEKLGLLEGHLIIGRRLLEASQARLALPHFGHPVEEIYDYLQPQFARRGVPQFAEELSALEMLVKAGQAATDGAFATAWDAVTSKLRAAFASIPAAKRNSDRFMLEHAALMLSNVAGDYGESIERGRIANVVEFHDSMGFLIYTRRMAAERQAASASPLWPEAIAEMDALQAAAFPQLMPPARPGATISAVRARAASLQRIAGRATA